jgi:uncharacterized protein YciI
MRSGLIADRRRPAMYAVAIVRYRTPIERVIEVTEAHRAYLRELKEKGTLLASGPMDPRYGGILLFRVPDADVDRTLDALRDGDPFVQQGIAQYELLRWAPGIGKDALDRL